MPTTQERKLKQGIEQQSRTQHYCLNNLKVASKEIERCMDWGDEEIKTQKLYFKKEFWGQSDHKNLWK